MPAARLQHMVRRALIKKISLLTDIGDVSYDIIRPVLMKIEKPNQLKSLEEACPQLIGADAEVWISFIKRDVPNAEEKMMHPRNPKNWWKVYDMMLKDHQKEVEEDAIKLKNAYKSIKEAKKPPPAIMEGVPSLPKVGAMKRAHLLPHNSCYATGRERKPKPPPTVQKKEPTGKAVMQKIRRQTMEQSQKWKASSTSVDRMNSLTSQVPVAPRHMVEQYQKSQAPKPVDPNVPKRAIVETQGSKISGVNRARLSAVELMDQQWREHTEQKKLAKAAQAASSVAYATSENAPNNVYQPPSPPKRPAWRPGRFMNVMAADIKATSGAKRRRLA